ncbi:MAG: hypothetical protein FK732_12205, partial [Asgard group archaeon]|nr:hypothetical protein [Asgard group archaeon]
MEKITELEKQEKYYEICLYLIEKFKKESKFLVNLFELDSKTDFSKEETELLDKAKSFFGTPNEWVIKFARDAGFLDVRKSGESKEIIKQIEKKLSKTYKEKAITLVEKKWTKVELEHPDNDLPKVEVAISFDKEFFKIKAEIQDN